MIDADLVRFLESPVMQIVATTNASKRAAIGRGVGAWACAERNHLRMAISAWQWPETIANLEASGRIAVTFARPADYVCYQVKGVATLRRADPDEMTRSNRYIVDMVTALMRMGLSPELIAPWLSNRDAMIASVEVSHIYEQTPGSTAGSMIWSAGS